MKGPDGNHFVWGSIIETHTIGDIDVVEHTTNLNTRLFHVFIDKKDTCQAAKSLFGALLLGIAKINKLPADAARYAAKILGVPSDD